MKQLIGIILFVLPMYLFPISFASEPHQRISVELFMVSGMSLSASTVEQSALEEDNFEMEEEVLRFSALSGRIAALRNLVLSFYKSCLGNGGGLEDRIPVPLYLNRAPPLT